MGFEKRIVNNTWFTNIPAAPAAGSRGYGNYTLLSTFTMLSELNASLLSAYC